MKAYSTIGKKSRHYSRLSKMYSQYSNIIYSYSMHGNKKSKISFSFITTNITSRSRTPCTTFDGSVIGKRR